MARINHKMVKHIPLIKVKIFLVFILFSYISTLSARTVIFGDVNCSKKSCDNLKGEKVIIVIIDSGVKNKSYSSKIKRNGSYKIKIPENYTKAIIECEPPGHKRFKQYIDLKDENIKIDFILDGHKDKRRKVARSSFLNELVNRTDEEWEELTGIAQKKEQTEERKFELQILNDFPNEKKYLPIDLGELNTFIQSIEVILNQTTDSGEKIFYKNKNIELLEIKNEILEVNKEIVELGKTAALPKVLSQKQYLNQKIILKKIEKLKIPKERRLKWKIESVNQKISKYKERRQELAAKEEERRVEEERRKRARRQRIIDEAQNHSTNTDSDVMNYWIGFHQKELIKAWGPPNSTADDGNGGTILIYTWKSQGRTKTIMKEFEKTTIGGHNTTITGRKLPRGYEIESKTTGAYTLQKMYYADTNGKIYHWLIR